jgi:hypothetical protein
MKKPLLFAGVSDLTAVLVLMLLSGTAPRLGTGTVEAQTCCNPPIRPFPQVKWPKPTVVRVKIEAGVFDDVELEGIKAAFRAWNARSLNNCSNVIYPEPYEVVEAPPTPGGKRLLREV